MNYLFDPPAISSLPVMGDERRFPVRRIFCIGRNYADHAREMGAAVERNQPTFFTKPADAIVSDGRDVPYPSATSMLHHEVEMVVALAEGGRDIDSSRASRLIFGHAVGLDLTRRDLQGVAKKKGLPWDTAKGMDHGAPVSALCPITSATPSPDTVLSLHVNDQLRQTTRLEAMLWTVPEIIAELSKLFELKPGDLIFTGTPAGVAALEPGDRFHAELADLAVLDGRIV
ncbi:MAG TPA: fumarylacetoacetate hydrolase family protein [Rhodanobacteraceae bacterium]|nr:fumarylacetoacetate hydrolase family protein [Rhodanobacteraceae bacterium]